MQKRFLIYTLLALAVSCTKEAVNHEPEEIAVIPEQTGHVPTGFRATLPTTATKTAVDMSTGIITWLADDPVFVSNGSESMTMFVEDGGSTEAALYAREEVIEGSGFYAVYPAGNADYLSGVFHSAIPSTQIYTRGGFASQSFPMVAICDKSRNFVFRNAASLLRIDTSAPSLLSGVRISSVTITADEAMTGEIAVSYSPGRNPEVDCSGGEKTVTVTAPEEGIPFGEPVYAVVAPGDYSNVSVRIALSNGLNYVFNPEGKVSVNRSACRQLSVSVEDNFTDLSAGGTANCYMITRGGSYKFRADVKGNGVETSCGIPAATSGISGVKVYYSDGDNFIDGSFALLGNYICFTTVKGGLPSGTALVSALDDDGRTLWSWHIWANGAIEDVQLSNGSVWLNMNLGAHQLEFNKEGYNGYYYQWGRKDPFLQKYTTSTAANVLAPFVSHASQTDGSLENSIANPHIFYGGFHPSGVTDITEDWSSYDDDYKVYDWWNKNVDGDAQNYVEPCKTMFDPCPAGYHVPVYYELDALLTMTAASSSTSSGGRTVEGKLFFPYTSYRYISLYAAWWPGGNEASRIFIPSATPYQTTTRHHRRFFRMYMTSSPSQGMSNGIRSYAVPVRCIKDGTTPVPAGNFTSSIEVLEPDDWE